jgi:ADP-ribose pyrophosphatase YjhB (NUDIX family)
MSHTPTPEFVLRDVEGDEKQRSVCQSCGFIDYVNPKIVAGAVVTDSHGRILMCKRAINPRSGFWTLPAGFMEEQESVAQGAAREAMEEANAKIEIDALIAIYSIPHISQIQMFFRARLVDPNISCGIESLEVALYKWDEIPMAELAFPSVRWALEDWRASQNDAAPQPALRSQGPDFAPINGVI